MTLDAVELVDVLGTALAVLAFRLFQLYRRDRRMRTHVHIPHQLAQEALAVLANYAQALDAVLPESARVALSQLRLQLAKLHDSDDAPAADLLVDGERGPEDDRADLVAAILDELAQPEHHHALRVLVDITAKRQRPQPADDTSAESET